jgi:hypothetical protein
MPHKVNDPRRHKIPKARYRIENWPAYDAALRDRGDLTVWVAPEALAAWHPPMNGQRGRSPTYSDLAIETALVHKSSIRGDQPGRFGCGVGAQIVGTGRSDGKSGFSSASGDAGGDRHAEPRHPVDHHTAHLGLEPLPGQTPSAQAPADQGLVAKHRGLAQRSATIAGCPLPAAAPALRDGVDMAVALRWRLVSLRAGLSRGAWRDDDVGSGRPLGDGPVYRLTIIGAVGGHRDDVTGNLIEQVPDLAGIADILVGQLVGQDRAAVGIDGQMISYRLSTAPDCPVWRRARHWQG